MTVITGYASLQTAVSDYANRTGDTAFTNFIPNFIQNWEERFYRDSRNYGPWMESAYSTAMSAGVSSAPAAFLKWKTVTISGSPSRQLFPVSLSQLYQNYPRGGGTAKPRWIARNGSNFEYGPQPDSDYLVVGSFYAKPTLLRSFASDAAAHYLILNAPDLLLYGALLEATAFLVSDERIPLWSQGYEIALDAYRGLQKDVNISGGPLVISAA